MPRWNNNPCNGVNWIYLNRKSSSKSSSNNSKHIIITKGGFFTFYKTWNNHYQKPIVTHFLNCTAPFTTDDGMPRSRIVLLHCNARQHRIYLTNFNGRYLVIRLIAPISCPAISISSDIFKPNFCLNFWGKWGKQNHLSKLAELVGSGIWCNNIKKVYSTISKSIGTTWRLCGKIKQICKSINVFHFISLFTSTIEIWKF